MADRNTDRTGQTPGSQASPDSSGLGSRSGSSQRNETTGATGSMSMGSSGTDSLKEAGGRVAEEAKHYAGDMAGRAKEQGRTMLEEKKDTAAEQVDSVAHAIRTTAEQLQGEGQSQTGRYIGMAAEQLESLARELRHRNLQSLMGDAEEMARRSPGVFFAGSVMAGFLFSRFLKSSAEHRYESSDQYRYGAAGMDDDMEYDDQLSFATYDDDRFDPASNAYQASAAGAAGIDPVGGTLQGNASSGSTASHGTSGIGAAGGTSTGTGTGSSATGSGTAASGSTSTNIGADGTGTGTPPSSSGTKPGGNTYGNR